MVAVEERRVRHGPGIRGRWWHDQEDDLQRVIGRVAVSGIDVECAAVFASRLASTLESMLPEETRSTVGASLLAKAVWRLPASLGLTRFCLFQKNFKRGIDLASVPA
ncbi:hypothetical protein EI534_07250 [Pseudomonas frederiksbergensis]|nr:hypothetical protein [Pseudomonas frederiksbergensis]